MSDHILAALRSGQAAEALSLAEAQLAEQPDTAENHYWKALALQSLGRKDEALLAIDAAIALAPERDDYSLTRSVMLLGERDLVGAQSGLMDALALNPNALNAYIGLIHIALGQNNLPEAKRLLRLAERVNDEDLDVLQSKAAIFQAEGSLDEALALFNRVSESRPNNPLILGSLATVYLQKEMPVFAEQAFRRACKAAPKNQGLWRGLVKSLLIQDKFAEAEAVLDEFLSSNPADASALGLMLRLRNSRGDLAGALQTAETWYSIDPDDMNALTELCNLYARAGRADDISGTLESALSRNANSDGVWQLRAGFEAAIGENPAPIIKRWLEQMPDSASGIEALAAHLEMLGQLQAAAFAADKALSINSALPIAQFIKVRQEVRETPEKALDRLQLLAKSAKTPEAQRMILGWFGLTYDRLGQYAQAASSYHQMIRFVMPHKTLPKLRPAVDAPEGNGSGRLLWAPVGARIERVLNVLSPLLGERLLVDRNKPTSARVDGFGPYGAIQKERLPASTKTWHEGIVALGLDPDRCVDWLPQWDAYTDAALRPAPLAAVLIDPRDAFLNWMVFGSAQSYVFLPDNMGSANWLVAVFSALADSVDADSARIHLIPMDDVDKNPAAVALALQRALALDTLPDIEMLSKPLLALGGMPNSFPAGHWRNYRDSFADAFDVLTPVAVALGYPKD